MSSCLGITSASRGGGASAVANEGAPTSTAGGEAPASGETEPADRSLPLLIAPAGGAAPRNLSEFARPRPPSPHEQRHRNHRARAAATRSQLRAGRPRQGPL